MGDIAVHEFVALDGVFEDPSWTFDYGFHPKMGDAIGAITDASTAILLGRTTYEMFAPAWSTRTVDDDPGAPFFNDTHKYVVGATEPNVDWGRPPVSGRTTPTRSADSRARPSAPSSPPAVAPSSARC
jgi:dihydrofolate reductase